MGMVGFNQKGYHGMSMSKRAVEAYEDGEKPKSKWTKKAMEQAVAQYCAEFDLVYDPELLRKMKKAEVFDRFFTWTSWHHTGKFAGETDFYGVDEEEVCSAFHEMDAEEMAAAKAAREEEARRAADLDRERRKRNAAEWEFEEDRGYRYRSFRHLEASHPEFVRRRMSKKGNEIVEVACSGGEIVSCPEDRIDERVINSWHKIDGWNPEDDLAQYMQGHRADRTSLLDCKRQLCNVADAFNSDRENTSLSEKGGR